MDPLRRIFLQQATKAAVSLGMLIPYAAWASPTTNPSTKLAAGLAKEFHLPLAWTADVLAKAQFQASVIERILHPYEAKPYAEYRPLFVNERLAQMGKEYIRIHANHFASAWSAYHVQAPLIAAILGMESRFGKLQGKDRVLDALYTLATGYPQRSSFFRKELGHFLLMCREEGLDPETLLGSYAGAFGATQFIPSSFRAYAVDADGDGKRDVWRSHADIIHSVANYFHRHGWDATAPVARWMPQGTHNPKLDAVSKTGLRQWYRMAQLRKMGLAFQHPDWNDQKRVSLILLKGDSGDRYVLVHYNFYVITRWNRSHNYAMAACELAAMMGCRTCRTS